ncbi:MAG: hypothetical protein A3J07_03670 [Candidatus Doudnabacteria bacterium RIFCSPLOWO2_02_FULL_49_13]|uniref:Uncharacterized protein n=1 Tax=Candidatus Doudnabacteria bacterium RIFCSPHIGHO2_12_FULL_48_16 TaxID=1817838 RepID=A0A1F5PJH7_9BACT|nr:MAG: hypothetical protein A3B77_02480 [Candidatus Doudnabacteria bacterium RIFCSPHIGHO2_02_FULL_49_24]OGE88146.1 MAG: hypothetical protein A2760_02870 [Candidatus Doudnabacteria bacterium RIFCSPHIGHO2_01_FULL_50_67]OGE90017.1 MAG: hypothetical protein A3E29_02815 [Candidatus Doudnabacteria bacterium RIFCSPHIGHO2_12_FULL_48_16]OGE96590.1 MAG: hypothetical protein A2990_00125 [Candidatus Doudnabacteria bacterium RIFCSPLOWO2_01_FULL_49_40]OGF03160.1 MAG: hypothetical protein A3J07_03670 [Candid
MSLTTRARSLESAIDLIRATRQAQPKRRIEVTVDDESRISPLLRAGADFVCVAPPAGKATH